jgi:hypothetical protein
MSPKFYLDAVEKIISFTLTRLELQPLGAERCKEESVKPFAYIGEYVGATTEPEGREMKCNVLWNLRRS